MNISQIMDKFEKEQIAAFVLSDLTDWFGMPEYTKNYITGSSGMPFWAAFHSNQPVGFVTLKETSPDTAEVYVMGILKNFHRMGIGRKLYEALEQYAQAHGYTFLQVKTVQMGHYDEYDRTNRFYLAMGFRELECFPTLWDPWNPCQVYVKYIESQIIEMEDILSEYMEEFWNYHIRYLVEDGIITDEEEQEYFQSEEYRGIIRNHMLRETDKHHMVYFLRAGSRIGAAQYNTYQSEDGKCFILDFWVFPEYRGGGTGHRCFEALESHTKADGAQYYELNCTRENAHRFWVSLGFQDNGADEYGMPLMIRRT